MDEVNQYVEQKLIRNATYRVPDGRLMRYTGPCTYKGQIRHNFYFPPLGLFYWYAPDEVEFYKG